MEKQFGGATAQAEVIGVKYPVRTKGAARDGAQRDALTSATAASRAERSSSAHACFRGSVWDSLPSSRWHIHWSGAALAENTASRFSSLVPGVSGTALSADSASSAKACAVCSAWYITPHARMARRSGSNFMVPDR